MVNRESLPLILGLLIPIAIVLTIILFYYGIDLTKFFREIPILYYIIIIPIALGLAVGIIKYLRPD